MLSAITIEQICLFAFAVIGTLGGCLQLVLGQPETTQRYDNLHRFMAGVYLGMAIICWWAGFTVREQGTLVYLLALGVFIAGCGRLLSMAKVGLPKPAALWLGYLAPELVLPLVLAGAHYSR